LNFQKYQATQYSLTTLQWLRESTNEASAASLTLRWRGHVIHLWRIRGGPRRQS